MTKRIAALIVSTAACAAQADFFFIGTEGEFEVTNRNGDMVDATITTTVGTQFGTFGFEDVAGMFTADLVDGGAMSGQLDLNGPGGGDVLTIDFSATVSDGGGFFSYSGEWTVVSGMGAYEDLVGAGTLSGSNFFDQGDAGFASLDIQGDLVPTPATLLLLAGAGLGAVRRRR